MFVRSVSRLPLISMPHSRKRNPEIAIITAKPGDYFILGPIPQPLYGIFQRQFWCLLKSARYCTHTITVRTHQWDIGGLSWQMSIPRLHSVQARPVWPQHLVNVWRQFQFLCNLLVYLGKEGESPEQQQGARVVSNLATLVYGSARNITTDNFFTSHALAKFLLGQNLTLLCTVRKMRKELPSEFVLKKHTSIESVFAFTEDTTSRTPQRKTRLL